MSDVVETTHLGALVSGAVGIAQLFQACFCLVATFRVVLPVVVAFFRVAWQQDGTGVCVSWSFAQELLSFSPLVVVAR